MKILVICQYYYPEPFRVNDICEELVRRGHEVTVITGEPNYPEGRIYSGYENHARTDENVNGVAVHRCPIIPRKTGSMLQLRVIFHLTQKSQGFVSKTRDLLRYLLNCCHLLPLERYALLHEIIITHYEIVLDCSCIFMEKLIT